MKERDNKIDILKYELFQVLLPKIIYNGKEKEDIEFFSDLIEDGNQLIFEMFSFLCKEDKVRCPFRLQDFKVETIKWENTKITKIEIPGYNYEINNILRAYIFFSTDKEDKNRVKWKKYFLIIQFKDRKKYIVYIDSKGKMCLGKELLEQDIEKEIWHVVKTYVELLVIDFSKK